MSFFGWILIKISDILSELWHGINILSIRPLQDFMHDHRNFMCRYNFTKCGNFIGRRQKTTTGWREGKVLSFTIQLWKVMWEDEDDDEDAEVFVATLRQSCRVIILFIMRGALHGNSRLYDSIWATLVDLYQRLIAGINGQLKLKSYWIWPDGKSIIIIKVIKFTINLEMSGRKYYLNGACIGCIENFNKSANSLTLLL